MADNLRVKEVQVAPFGDGDGDDDDARTQRFVVCHNPEAAERDQQVRANLVTHLEQLIDSSDTWTARRRDELVGSLRTKPGLRRYLRRTAAGLLRTDHTAIRREQHPREDRIRAHIPLCWLALLLIRVIENATADTWCDTRHELDRMALATDHGRVAQRSALTAGHKTILTALGLPEPPRYFDFTATTSS